MARQKYCEIARESVHYTMNGMPVAVEPIWFWWYQCVDYGISIPMRWPWGPNWWSRSGKWNNGISMVDGVKLHYGRFEEIFIAPSRYRMSFSRVQITRTTCEVKRESVGVSIAL
jgi:hypothetical protein